MLTNKNYINIHNNSIGFAVAMDFCLHEEAGHLAALTLLEKLDPLHQAH